MLDIAGNKLYITLPHPLYSLYIHRHNLNKINHIVHLDKLKDLDLILEWSAIPTLIRKIIYVS